jgi:hypothetical protein
LVYSTKQRFPHALQGLLRNPAQLCIFKEHLMSDDVSNKEELKDLLGVQSNKPRRHNAQPHESSLGKGLSAELHSWIRFCMGG